MHSVTVMWLYTVEQEIQQRRIQATQTQHVFYRSGMQWDVE